MQVSDHYVSLTKILVSDALTEVQGRHRSRCLNYVLVCCKHSVVSHTSISPFLILLSTDAMSSIVRFRIPQGDRPSLEEIRCQAAGRAGLTGLVELMEKCWEARAAQRPSSFGKINYLACRAGTRGDVKRRLEYLEDNRLTYRQCWSNGHLGPD